jgi:hypothetical protein
MVFRGFSYSVKDFFYKKPQNLFGDILFFHAQKALVRHQAGAEDGFCDFPARELRKLE